MSEIEFKGDTEKEKELNKEIFNCTLTIAQKDDEIRELKDKLQQKDDEIRELKDKLQQKENIIKEVKEKIKTKYIIQGGLTSYEVNDLLNELLEILDKEKE